MSYIVVAYYTKNTPYEEEVKTLIASLEEFNLPMDIVGIPNQGSWKANVSYKPYFINQMLIRHFPLDVLYLDADSAVRKPLTLFDKVDFDLGVYWDGKVGKGYFENPSLWSGMVYFANKPNIFELVRRWMLLCIIYPETIDQVLLEMVISQAANDIHLNISYLPATYCKIFDTVHDVEAVIEQHQASRRFKTQMG